MQYLTPDERERAVARYRCLRGQGGIRLSFVAWGPIVKAGSPRALVVAVDHELVLQGETDPAS